MKIVHCSDLHFGREVENLFPAFNNKLKEMKPDLVVVSGDFTQHAWHGEFAKARAFLHSLPCPFFVVPGNHDIPGHHLVERFFRPYARYRHYLAEDLCPVLETPTAVFAGINSARRLLPHWNWANGAVSESQRGRLEDVFSRANGRCKIVVLHHPVQLIENAPISIHVFGGRKTLETFAKLGIDLVMTGHVHRASVCVLPEYDYQTVYLSASTALSSRLRDEENGFNSITLNERQIVIEFYKYRAGTFTAEPQILYKRIGP
jgi:3',5'-cyclic AMP phosphodiesterase CpdA